MAGPNLPVTIDSTYTNSGSDATVQLHQQHHDAIHSIVNRFDTGIGTATNGHVLTWNGTVYAPAAATSGTGSGSMPVESDAGVTTANSGATNRTNFNTWAAANVGTPIFFRAGIYDFSGGSLNPKGSVFGAGPGVSILRFPEMNVGSVYVVSVNNITLANFEIRSTSTATPLATGINSSSSNHLTLDTCTLFDVSNVYCNGAANMGIHIRVASRGRITGCRVFGTCRDGIHVTSGSTDVSVIGNQIRNTGDDGIALVTYETDTAANTRIAVVGNTIGTTFRDTRGITLEGALNCVAVGNTVTNTDGYGILINSIGASVTDTWGTTNTVVADNVVANANSDGIHVNGKTEGVTIRGNSVRSAASASLRVLVGRVTVDGNNFDLNGAGEMVVINNNTGNQWSTFTNNVLRRARTLAFYCAASNIRFSGNSIQQPNEDGTSRPGATFYSCSNIMATDNRIDGTSGRLGQGIFFDAVTGGLVQGNYAINASIATYASNASTGILTA